ncbi:HD domain-containing protein [Clostridium drakei]|uniref:HD family phosphohydrolase n=1 Tax=Clostridium drakei TaxID=332101 RepID=A0A2U8DLX6_9CLOT|nr:HD domain-containing protein [Clostridium drakei]AWI03204.1 HD family phosphohydrolase [Clostridium drakei]
MIKWIRLKLSLKIDFFSNKEYGKCVYDVIHHEMIISMKNYIQHGNTNCFEHSIYVSYISYMICKRLGLDFQSAARGGLLHDFFLYDWHMKRPQKGLHGFIHPNIALQNATKYFKLNDNEKDIIQKHMWPLTITLPRYKESFVVLCADKYCTLMETLGLSIIGK